MSKVYQLQITNKFKKQYAKIKRQQNFKKEEFEKVIDLLMNNKILPEKYKNHLLTPKHNRNMGMLYSARHITGI